MENSAREQLPLGQRQSEVAEDDQGVRHAGYPACDCDVCSNEYVCPVWSVMLARGAVLAFTLAAAIGGLTVWLTD